MCRLLLPKHHINRIRYFTAHVSARIGSPDAPLNQQVYLRALKTIPNLSIHLGEFLTHDRYMPLSSSTTNPPEKVKVRRTDEKGTDVNLATYLLFDLYESDCECAVVVSNDSDLFEPLRIAKEHLKRRVGVINPHEHPSKKLKQCATFVKSVREGVLAASQFPPLLTDRHGLITKPPTW